VSSEDADLERVAALKRLYADWAMEFEQIKGRDPERTRHHAEALADLESLIRRLEDNHTA
jgi:hypothetical protein